MDIFSHLLTLSDYYLPVSSFLVLRVSCKQLHKFYTKQRYINKYTKKINVTRISKFSDSIVSIDEYYILPNKKFHGVYTSHRFVSRHYADWSDDIAERRIIAKKYGYEGYLYRSTIEIRYYLGNSGGLVTHTKKLLGCNHIYSIYAKISDVQLIEWEYIEMYSREKTGCLKSECSSTYDAGKFKRVGWLGGRHLMAIVGSDDW